MERYDHIVWDYNGTIVDDVAHGIACVNTLLRRRGKQTIDSKERYFEIFGFPIRDYYERAGFDFSIERYDDVAVEWVNEYRAGEASLPMNDGVRELLAFFASVGVGQSVLSMSEAGMLCEAIERFGIRDYFDEICGKKDIYAYSKSDLAIRFARARDRGRVLMIGDTEHDYACARAAGFDMVLVARGHATEESLRATCDCPVYPDYHALMRDVREAYGGSPVRL